MKRIVHVLAFLSVFSCNPTQQNDQTSEAVAKSEEPCPEEWNLNGPADEPRSLKERIVNDTTVQQILDDKVFFEIIGAKKHNGMTRAYLKFYRTDGTIEKEGFAIYADHPIADFERDGEWKHYDCNGAVTKN